MGDLVNFVTPLHQETKRDYLGRMVDEKVQCMLKAKKYEEEYQLKLDEFEDYTYKTDELYIEFNKTDLNLLDSCCYVKDIDDNRLFIKKNEVATKNGALKVLNLLII